MDECLDEETYGIFFDYMFGTVTLEQLIEELERRENDYGKHCRYRTQIKDK